MDINIFLEDSEFELEHKTSDQVKTFLLQIDLHVRCKKNSVRE